MAALAEGRSVIRGLSSGQDVAHTLGAVRAFGAGVTSEGPDVVVVDGGRDRLGEPDVVIDVGNSGTGIRLLAGWAAGIDGMCVLAGDQSIARRPMDRVAVPLRLMGCQIDGRRRGRLPPLVVRGGQLHGVDYRVPIPSAQVKGAILLAGLSADGPTTVHEHIPTRMHSEEMLRLFGADVRVDGRSITVQPGPLHPVETDVPGDPSQAAFWVVAACITPGSDLTVEHVYVGPGRAGFLDVLERMGADVTLENHDRGTSTADIRARFSSLTGTDVGGDEIPGLIDEIPVLAVAAAIAAGDTTFRDAAELRVKESDRITAVVESLRALGVDAVEAPDGLTVHGRRGELAGGVSIDSAGDHRIAMSVAVAALAGQDAVTITGWDAVATSYPGFERDFELCGS
jgi:3-phosphoshikimate 1-carboxyvinyltransferase